MTFIPENENPITEEIYQARLTKIINIMEQDRCYKYNSIDDQKIGFEKCIFTPGPMASIHSYVEFELWGIHHMPDNIFNKWLEDYVVNGD